MIEIKDKLITLEYLKSLQLKNCIQYFHFYNCNFDIEILEKFNFFDCNFYNCNFDSSFKDCIFKYCDFKNSNFDYTVFFKCDLHNTKFNYCNLNSIMFTNLQSLFFYFDNCNFNKHLKIENNNILDKGKITIVNSKLCDLIVRNNINTDIILKNCNHIINLNYCNNKNSDLKIKLTI